MNCRHRMEESKCAFCKATKKTGVKTKIDTVFEQRDLFGRLHGTQPQIGTGEVVYNHGTLEYLDDGNGNVYDINDDRNWE